MKLTVLGCWAPYPRAGGACSGYLLEANDHALLLDCGNGTLSNLMLHLDFRKLTGLVITHFHPDHYVDIYCLRHALKGSLADGSRQQPLPVWIPSEPVEVASKLKEYQDVFSLKTLESLREPLVLGDLTVEFYPTKHSLVTYAVKVTQAGGNSICYTADTAWDEDLVNWSRGVKLLLVEASLQKKDEAVTRVGHLTTEQAGLWGRYIDADQVVITHFWPEYNLQVSKDEATGAFGKDVLLASEGLIIEV